MLFRIAQLRSYFESNRALDPKAAPKIAEILLRIGDFDISALEADFRYWADLKGDPLHEWSNALTTLKELQEEAKLHQVPNELE